MALNAMLLDARKWAVAPLLEIFTLLRRQSLVPSLNWNAENTQVVILGESASGDARIELSLHGDLNFKFNTRHGLAAVPSWQAFSASPRENREPWEPVLIKALISLELNPQNIWLRDTTNNIPWLTFRHNDSREKFVLMVDSNLRGFSCTNLVTGDVSKGRMWGETLVVEDMGISVPPLYPTPPLAALSLAASSG